MNETDRILTKKDINRAQTRWFMSLEYPNSFERLQAVSFCSAMSGPLKKLYKDDHDGLVDGLNRHLEFYNTEGTIGGLPLGLIISLEEQMKIDQNVEPEVITNLKVGLMGPIAGIGDTLIQGTLKSIWFALACSLGMQGNYVAVLLPFLHPITVFTVSRYLANLGYKLGMGAIDQVINSGLMTRIIDAAAILGLFMMGALSSSYVKLSTVLSFSIGEQKIVLQDILDQLVPGILPLACIFGIVWYFKNKKQNYLLLVFTIIALGMLGSAIGVF